MRSESFVDWARSKEGLAIWVPAAFLILALILLAFLGIEFAGRFLVGLSGAAAGGGLAYLVFRPFRETIYGYSRVRRILTGLSVGLVWVFVMGFLVEYLTGYSLSSFQERDVLGDLFYGAYFGFGIGLVSSFLASPVQMTPEEARQNRRAAWQGLLIMIGALLLLLTLAFLLYVALEHLVTPLVRYFAG